LSGVLVKTSVEVCGWPRCNSLKSRSFKNL
jgi:hypothetical protein